MYTGYLFHMSAKIIHLPLTSEFSIRNITVTIKGYTIMVSSSAHKVQITA